MQFYELLKPNNREHKIEHMYKTLIRPIVVNEAESWTIFGGVWILDFEKDIIKQGKNWRIISNDKLYELYKEIDLKTHVKLIELRWLAQVIRMGNSRKNKTVCNGTPEGRNQEVDWE